MYIRTLVSMSVFLHIAFAFPVDYPNLPSNESQKLQDLPTQELTTWEQTKSYGITVGKSGALTILPTVLFLEATHSAKASAVSPWILSAIDVGIFTAGTFWAEPRFNGEDQNTKTRYFCKSVAGIATLGSVILRHITSLGGSSVAGDV